MDKEISNTGFTSDINISNFQENIQKISHLHTIIQNLLKKDYDYGTIPGTIKPTLLKPGGEKICMALGLTPFYEFLSIVEDYERNLFSYNFKCTLKKGENSVAEGVGSCNSKEKRYRYSFVTNIPENYIGTNEKFADKFGNIKYRIENPDLCNFANTILKMAKKRAFIDAVLQVAGLSEIFTQDLEDLSDIISTRKNTTTNNKPSNAI